MKGIGRRLLKALSRFNRKHFSGHWTLGRLTIYGENAMKWSAEIQGRKGFLVFKLPIPCGGYWWPLWMYASKDATPCTAVFMLGDPDKEPKGYDTAA